MLVSKQLLKATQLGSKQNFLKTATVVGLKSCPNTQHENEREELTVFGLRLWQLRAVTANKWEVIPQHINTPPPTKKHTSHLEVIMTHSNENIKKPRLGWLEPREFCEVYIVALLEVSSTRTICMCSRLTCPSNLKAPFGLDFSLTIVNLCLLQPKITLCVEAFSPKQRAEESLLTC